jgi:hypothetical protein
MTSSSKTARWANANHCKDYCHIQPKTRVKETVYFKKQVHGICVLYAVNNVFGAPLLTNVAVVFCLSFANRCMHQAQTLVGRHYPDACDHHGGNEEISWTQNVLNEALKVKGYWLNCAIKLTNHNLKYECWGKNWTIKKPYKIVEHI